MTYGALPSTELIAACKFEEAIAAADKEIATTPEEPEAYFNRGQAQAGLGRFDQAAADYERALTLDASSSGVDPEAIDDELFFALRNIATTQRSTPAIAIATLERYRKLLPAGRHIDDIEKWVNHVNGVEVVWVRETA
jgi:tetratricopeptide (TPR) repeat protein